MSRATKQTKGVTYTVISKKGTVPIIDLFDFVGVDYLTLVSSWFGWFQKQKKVFLTIIHIAQVWS